MREERDTAPPKKLVQKKTLTRKRKKQKQKNFSHFFTTTRRSVTYASSFPDRLRLIKTVHLFPLQLKLKADYVRAAGTCRSGVP